MKMNRELSSKRSRLPNLHHQLVAVFLSVYFLLDGPHRRLATAAPQISSVALSQGQINLAWTGAAGSYQVQVTTNLTDGPWIPLVDTGRTNVLVPIRNTSGFLRVVDPGTNAVSLVATTTNLVTGEVLAFTLLPRTNADWVFNGPTNYNGLDQVQALLTGADLQNFDLVYDGRGGFTVVTTNGQPTGAGGWLNSTPGPGLNQVTYSGLVTNGTSAATFAGTVDWLPQAILIVLALAAGCWVENLVAEAACQLTHTQEKAACESPLPPPLGPGGPGGTGIITYVRQFNWTASTNGYWGCGGYCTFTCKK
jgi:hypothetical protein